MTEIPIRCYGVAAVIVRNTGEDAEFLALKRTRPPIGTWTYVAGGIEPNEKAFQTAFRETREETGLEIRTLYSSDLCEQFYESGNDSIWLAPVFVGFVDSTREVELNDEHSEFHWCTIDEYEELLTFPGAKHIARNVCEYFVIRTPIEALRIDT